MAVAAVAEWPSPAVVGSAAGAVAEAVAEEVVVEEEEEDEDPAASLALTGDGFGLGAATADTAAGAGGAAVGAFLGACGWAATSDAMVVAGTAGVMAAVVPLAAMEMIIWGEGGEGSQKK